MGVIGTKQRVFFRTQAQFDALSAPQKIDGALYYIYDRGKLYQYDGTASKFINYAGSFEILAERPTTPIVGKLYIIGAPGAYKLEFYFGGTWETIGGGLTIGETSATAYRGDRGKTAYDHSQSTGNPHSTTFAQINSKPTTLAGYGITDALAASLKGAANGLAELDSGGKVPSSQLPSYVDDVLEYTTFSLLPSVGESGKIYITTDTNKTYRWSGSVYTEISKSLALGETSATAYRGDRGKTAYDHSQSTGNPHSTTFAQLGSKPTTLAGYGITDAATSTHTHTFASITSKPTTLAGYGITDAANAVHGHSYIVPILSGILPETLTDYSSYCANYHKGVSVIVNTGGSAVGNVGAVDTVVNFGTGSFRFFRLLNNRGGSLRWQTSNFESTDFATERTLFDNYNYASYYPDLSAIESISGTNGFLKKTAANTWALDTNNYSLSTHQHNFASITSKPTTLAGYGITDALSLGETSATAYRGDRGKTAYNHSQSTGNPHSTTFAQLGSKPTTLAGYGITDATPSSINNGRYITDGVNLTGTYVRGSIRMSTQAEATGYPSAYGTTYTFDAATPSRAFSIFTPRLSNDLYIQKYSDSSVGLGWYKIFTTANLNPSNYLTKRYETYSELTYGSSIIWDCSTGLNKTLTASGNFTINLTNLENGMSGDLRITSSTIITITLPSSSKLNGNVSNLPAGIYHLAWVYNGSVLDFNIALYE